MPLASLPRATALIVLVQAVLFFSAWTASGRPGGWFAHLEIETLIRWGANGAPWTQGGEWWRLLSSRLLTQNIVSLAIDAWFLWSAGGILERRLGPWGLLVVYFGASAVSGLATLAFNPPNHMVVGSVAPLLGVFGAIAGNAIARREAPSRGEWRTLRFSGPCFALLLGFVVWLGRLDIAGVSTGFLSGALLGLALTPGASQPDGRQTGANWALAGAIVLIGSGLAWTQLKKPSFLAVDAGAALARLQPFGERQMALKAELRSWWEKAEDAKPPYKAEIESLESKQLPEWRRLREELRAQPSSPSTAGAHYVPQGRANVERTVRGLEAAAASLRGGDEPARKKARDHAFDTMMAIHNVHDLALIRDPERREADGQGEKQ